MKSSGAHIMKAYLEKYVFVNQYKTKKNKYDDPYIARQSLAIAYNLIHEMEDLIKSNHADNFDQIKKAVKEQVSVMHHVLKERQPKLRMWFLKTTLPSDFSKCLYEGWAKLHELEKTISKRRN